MDSDVGYDDLVETQTFALRELELNKPLLKTFKFNKVFLTIQALRVISIKFLLVISILCKTEWSRELRT